VGQVDSFSRGSGGVDVNWSDEPAAGPGNARIVLDANVGMGRLAIGHQDDGPYFKSDFGRGRGEFDFSGQQNSGCEVPNGG
jgi:hypothetical protein